MKIVFFECAVPKVDESLVLQSFSGMEVVFFEDKLDESTVDKAKDAEVVSVFVNSVVNKNVIDTLPNLKYIATRSTGFDHIDCEYAKNKGIAVSNVPAYGSYTVAEFAFGLILDLSRNIIKASNHVKETSDFKYSAKVEGFDLHGKTIGILGTGKIGKNVAKIANGFGMNIVAYDLYPDETFAKENNLENNFKYKSLEEVISESDIITLHAPYNKENHHLINKENIARMKRGVYLINTARGELIDENALVSGLKEGIIAGFGADVLERDQAHLNQELIKMQNVIITPHIAYYTREAVAGILQTTIYNIQGFIDSKPVNLIK